MSSSIKTNQLVCFIDRKQFADCYDVYYLETIDKYIKRGAYILDVAELDNDIKSIKFESGKRVYLLLQTNPANKDKIKSLLPGIEDGDRYSIGKADVSELSDDIIVQLLLNALGSYDSEFLKFNNLTGHLYCFHTDWIKHGKDKSTDVIWRVPCLELSVTKEMSLNLNVRTFTSELLRNRITFTKKKFEDYPKYVFAANNTLRRRLKDDNETCFIMRQIDCTKTEIPFLDLQNIAKFQHTKMGVLNSVLNTFNEKYSDMCKLEFACKEISSRLDYSKSVQKENTKRIKEVLEKKGVQLIDQIGDEYSAIFTDNIKSLLESKYDIRPTIGKRVSKDKLNIMIIHNAEYYNGVNDPHDKVYEDAAIQHITFEDFSDSSEFAIATVVHEIIIKKDIQERKLSLFDWSELGFEEPVSFGIEAEIDEIKRYFFITVNPDGDFEIKEQELTLFEMDEYTEMVEIFEQGRTDSETVKGVIRFADSSINVIKDSGVFTLPKIDKIAELLDKGDNRLRGKARREELLSSCLDIKMYEENGQCYFCVGTIGEGMRPNIQRASVVRTMEGYNGVEVKFEQILPMMNVTFVRNGQLTVLPFPFKYLKEYVKILGAS